MDTIDPLPLGIMMRAACFVPKKTPLTFTPNTRSNSATSNSRTSRHAVGPSTPALFTITSRPPNLSTAWSTARRTSSSTVTSQRTNETLLLPTRQRSLGSRTSATQTLAPCLRNERTMLSPMPLAPPVTSPTLPTSLINN
ncbi:nucleic acid-binding [Striga asiatica]|uniref:Nucleic acid-binding n=1 Tax=Striga asiatica TaxID=4170 RepID=A0A5A7P4T2_STRAF|nr:nucleic acid-binding [Striga asiatica]